MINIPLRPKADAEFPQLKKIDKDIIAYAVLFGADNQTAFMRFHPEFMADSKTMNQAGKQASRQFWSWGKVKDYRHAYEETVEEFLNGKKRTAKSETASIDDNRKDRALKSLLNQAMSLVEGGTDLDADTIKVCSDIFTKLGLIKGEEEQQEKPRRYIPAKCLSECAYRLFVESHIESGDIVSECDYCRTRKFAEDNGWHFDPTKNLDLPNTKSDEQNN